MCDIPGILGKAGKSCGILGFWVSGQEEVTACGKVKFIESGCLGRTNNGLLLEKVHEI